MTTFRLFTAKPPNVPMSAAWYLADLGEAKGKQDLFARQSPQRQPLLEEKRCREGTGTSALPQFPQR